jgi:hypothetical protein
MYNTANIDSNRQKVLDSDLVKGGVFNITVQTQQMIELQHVDHHPYNYMNVAFIDLTKGEVLHYNDGDINTYQLDYWLAEAVNNWGIGID